MLRITVPPDIQTKLCVALEKAGRNECGGVLMGEHVGHNHFAVRSLTIQGVGSIASFLRGIREAISAIRAYFSSTGRDFSRFNYLGEWHSHPIFSTEPSSTDHSSMQEIAADPKVGANFVVLLVFRLDGDRNLQGSAHTYLPDGGVWPSELDMKEMI
jgi:integrative and conjugative element protein (TIGR02256 family)